VYFDTKKFCQTEH